MKNIAISIGLILLFSGIGSSQFLSWEDVHNLGNVPISGVASDDYGQHVVTYDGSTVKHYLYRNDGTIIWNNLSVTGASYPAVTSFNGKIRVIMKSGSNIRIDQSTNGGSSWSTLPTYTPPGGIGINDIDAYTDANGTHIAWDDAGCGSEVYYVRFKDATQSFVDFKNVTDLS